MAQHPTYELPVDDSALLLMPCPGTKGLGLQESLEQLRDQGVKAIVTLITDEEMKEMKVTTLGTNAEELGIRWYHFSIEDDRVPDENFATGWAEASPELHQVLKDGGKVAIHCMGGSGRTGMVTAHLLLEKGWELPKIVQQVKNLRPGAYTAPGQLEYVESVATEMQTKDHHFNRKGPRNATECFAELNDGSQAGHPFYLCSIIQIVSTRAIDRSRLTLLYSVRPSFVIKSAHLLKDF
jgi:protein-tyrosine phosphatase